jgi:hypothetical protein
MLYSSYASAPFDDAVECGDTRVMKNMDVWG